MFLFIFYNLSILFHILGLKVMLQNCNLIPVQKLVFPGTVLASTGFRVKKIDEKITSVLDFWTLQHACARLCWERVRD